MKVLIIGASGGTGQYVIEQALALGHQVTAFVRNPAKLKFSHAHLNVMQGDVMVLSTLQTAMQHQEAVICCLGAPALKAGKLRSIGTQHIIKAMNENNVSRLICQSSLGFGDSAVLLDNASFFTKNFIVPFILRKTFEEHAIQEKLIQQSNLNWTIVRPATMDNGKYTGVYKHGFPYTDKSLTLKISKADVANFLVAQLSSATYQGKITGISY
ncbi:MAG: SDR family oxidoreductase [Cytophagaceae bacterium]|jgi:putative NADH-flavin reductase|nr:SDR family oxidoreductase [Cytophagaceae bacterium]